MAPRPKPSKRDAILDAMLDIVVERGFHDAPMFLIAQRSGASAGVIYHYLSSKEEIVHTLYERIRALKAESLLLSNPYPFESLRGYFVACWSFIA